jgi:16S rRNA A1518/A1519 N6-dimethyltransferase RsmA/KsgA/DIM1 with predicted DNA glycosylase/AP lyase activity
VDSAVVRLVPREPTLVAASEEVGLRRFTQGVFGFRRKQMVRVLRELRGVSAEAARDLLRTAGIAAEARPEALSPEDFLRMFRTVAGDGEP